MFTFASSSLKVFFKFPAGQKVLASLVTPTLATEDLKERAAEMESRTDLSGIEDLPQFLKQCITDGVWP